MTNEVGVSFSKVTGCAMNDCVRSVALTIRRVRSIPIVKSDGFALEALSMLAFRLSDVFAESLDQFDDRQFRMNCGLGVS